MSRAEPRGRIGAAEAEHGAAVPSAGRDGAAGERLILLMEEFRRRERRRPELVVRPWWVPGSPGDAPRPSKGGSPSFRSLCPPLGAVGFIVEYCPGGVESAELAVRVDRVRVEGASGVVEGRLDLRTGWVLDGADRQCAETLANHLLGMADGVLD